MRKGGWRTWKAVRSEPLRAAKECERLSAWSRCVTPPDSHPAFLPFMGVSVELPSRRPTPNRQPSRTWLLLRSFRTYDSAQVLFIVGTCKTQLQGNINVYLTSIMAGQPSTSSASLCIAVSHINHTNDAAQAGMRESALHPPPSPSWLGAIIEQRAAQRRQIREGRRASDRFRTDIH